MKIDPMYRSAAVIGAPVASDCVKVSTPFDGVFRQIDRAESAADRAERLVAKLTGALQGVPVPAKPTQPGSTSVFGQVRDAGEFIAAALDRINEAISRIEADLP